MSWKIVGVDFWAWMSGDDLIWAILILLVCFRVNNVDLRFEALKR